MRKRIKTDSETEARWDEAQRALQARLDYHEAKIRERNEREERRRRRLHRLTFGLLPR